ncbi:hypothetical protein ACFST9_04255 [Hymenobacter monticola]
MSFLGGLIGVWVTLNNKITRLETSQEELRQKMTGFYSDQKELSKELKELNQNMHKMMVDLARISTFIEVSKEIKDHK